MFREIITRFQKRHVELSVDPLLHTHLPIKYQSNSLIRFRFNLHNLIMAIGLSRSVRITKRVKFTDAAEYLERFTKDDNNELRVHINDDVEDKMQIAECIGMGLSIVIAEELYALQRSSISKIKRKGRESKPDFEGYKKNNLKVVWEAKGSTNVIDQETISRGINQKRMVPADISFASFATLKSDCMSKVSIEDPPKLPLIGKDLQIKLARVRHYVDLFNFIGQNELSRYFKYVGERLRKDMQFPEFAKKVDLYKKIKKNYARIDIRGKTYFGNIERISDSEYLYVGFDERLLSVYDFIDFKDYPKDYTYSDKDNKFIISKDGICFGYIRDLKFIEDQIDIKKIAYYKENVSLGDLDDMFEFQLIDLVSYFFEKEGFVIKKEPFKDVQKCDLIAEKDSKKYVVEVKKEVILKSFEEIKRFKEIFNADMAFLITTTRISDVDIYYAKSQNVIIIDRDGLRGIIRNKKRIVDFIDKS